MENAWNTKSSSSRPASLHLRPSETVSKRTLDLQLSGDERWYVVHTQPLREAAAEAQLTRQSFRVFLPVQMKTVRHARKLGFVRAPVFLRYLFVILDLERDRWRSVNGTSGVSRLVMAEGWPLPLPVGVVETLVSSADEKGLVRFEEELKPGQAIRLRAGPFAEAFGVLSRLDGGGRVEVLMQILNGQIRLNLPRDGVEPLHDQIRA